MHKGISPDSLNWSVIVYCFLHYLTTRLILQLFILYNNKSALLVQNNHHRIRASEIDLLRFSEHDVSWMKFFVLVTITKLIIWGYKISHKIGL